MLASASTRFVAYEKRRFDGSKNISQLCRNAAIASRVSVKPSSFRPINLAAAPAAKPARLGHAQTKSFAEAQSSAGTIPEFSSISRIASRNEMSAMARVVRARGHGGRELRFAERDFRLAQLPPRHPDHQGRAVRVRMSRQTALPEICLGEKRTPASQCTAIFREACNYAFPNFCGHFLRSIVRSRFVLPGLGRGVPREGHPREAVLAPTLGVQFGH